jgi:hypothetical protein
MTKKILGKKPFFLLAIRIRNSVYGSKNLDPDPYQTVTDPEHCREWCHWIGLAQVSTFLGFLFFYSHLDFLNGKFYAV